MEPLPEAERIARTESLFREVNERIAESAKRLGGDDADFVCECADATCTERVAASLDEYERIRAEGTTFLLAPGHEDRRVETVVEREDAHAVVEKTDPQVVPIVRALDPRSA
jgi:hypothetical protein